MLTGCRAAIISCRFYCHQIRGEPGCLSAIWNLVRKLLLQTEGVTEQDLSQYDQDSINYHYHLLIDAGFLEGKIHWVTNRTKGRVAGAVTINGLTWAGHEFLDDARNETVWNKAMQTVNGTGGSISLSILSTLLQSVAKQLLGLP